MTDTITDILTSSSPSLPDYCRLGNRVFVTDGFHNNKVIVNSDGAWRPMGAREQAAPIGITAAEDADGPLPYGSRVTYAIRRVVTSYGLEIPGGLSVEYAQLQAYGGSDDPEPKLAASLTVMPYEYDAGDGSVVSYEIYRSRTSSYQILYKAATLTHAQVSALPGHRYKDTVPDSSLSDAYIDLASDGMDLTIPPCRFIRSWRGSLVCGGFLRSPVTVTGLSGGTALTTAPELPADDVGCWLTIDGEPYSRQITDIDAEGNVTVDTALAESHDESDAVRWRDDDVVYVSRPLAGNIEVYSAETGRVITNAGADNAITGIASHGSYAYIFRRDTVEILTGTPESPTLEPFPGNPPGCRGHATIADALSPCVFYYSGVKGVWSISGSEASRISGPVDRILEDDVDHEQDERCHGVYDPSARMYWLFLFSANWREYGIRMPDMFLCLDVATMSWSRGELFASRSGLFRNPAGEMVPVIGVPGGVAVLGTGDADGGASAGGRVAAYGPDWVRLTGIQGDLSSVRPGSPVHAWDPSGPASAAVRRMVKLADGDTLSIYGEWPEGLDMNQLICQCGAIRWSFRTPEIGLSGDFDRVVKLGTVAIAHGKSEDGMDVDVRLRTIGELSGKSTDSQQWRIDFSGRSVSRIDGRGTGLRGASFQLEAEGSHAPATVKAVRIETSRSAR